MKYYKLDNTKITDARNTDPLDCVFADGTFSFYVSESDEDLAAPFEALEFDDLPQEAKDNIQTALNDTKLGYINQAKSKVERITLFVSDVLGSTHTYDFSMQDQANLLQAKDYIDALGDSDTVGIRCTAENGIKDNYPHTKAQVSKLFNDWYSFKSSILNAFSTLKIEIASATSKSECESAFTKFSSVFETKSVK